MPAKGYGLPFNICKGSVCQQAFILNVTLSHGVSFCHDENVLRLSVEMVAHL